MRAIACLLLVILAACNGGPRPSDPLGVCSRQGAPFLETRSIALRVDFRDALAASGDLNGDADPEIVVVSPTGGVDVVTVAPNQLVRVGSLTQLASFSAPGRVTGVALADLDGDGADEIIVAGVVASQPRPLTRVEVLDGTSRQPTRRLDLPAGYPTLTSADLDGDGLPEIVVGDLNRRVVVVLGADAGALAVRSEMPAAAPNRIATRDLDGDGAPELLASAFVPGQATLTVHRGARGGFDGSATRTVPIAADRFAVVASRFTSAAERQLLSATTTLQSLDASVPSPGTALGFEARDLQVLDVDGDGRQDVLAVAYPGAFAASGQPLLGAIVYREGDDWSAAKPIEIAAPAREVMPVLMRDPSRVGEPWVPVLAVLTQDTAGAPQLRVLSNLCAPANSLAITNIGAPAQVVQGRDASVTLYAGKPTAVSVHVASRHAVRGVTLDAVLRDAAGTISRQLVVARPGPRQDLGPGLDGEATFQVVIPAGFAIEGDHVVDVRARVARGLAPASLSANQTIPVHFARSTPIRFAVVDWRHGVCSVSSGVRCAPNSPVTVRPPTPPAAIDEAVQKLRAVLPSGDVEIVVNEFIDTAFAVPANVGAPGTFGAELNAARARFDAQGPGRGSMPAYFLADGALGVTADLGGRTATGDVLRVIHEVGHMAGAKHVSCLPGNIPDDVDTTYPFYEGRIGGPASDPTRYFGVKFSDLNTRRPRVDRVPPETCDLMSYGSSTWLSSWSYGYFERALSRWAR